MEYSIIKYRMGGVVKWYEALGGAGHISTVVSGCMTMEKKEWCADSMISMIYSLEQFPIWSKLDFRVVMGLLFSCLLFATYFICIINTHFWLTLRLLKVGH